LLIQSLEKLTKLKTLELGGNRLKEIEGLDTLIKLEELWLGRNRITTITNLNWSPPPPPLPHPFTPSILITISYSETLYTLYWGCT
jgi:Leucine-rich repeat (LRR) protein